MRNLLGPTDHIVEMTVDNMLYFATLTSLATPHCLVWGQPWPSLAHSLPTHSIVFRNVAHSESNATTKEGFLPSVSSFLPEQAFGLHAGVTTMVSHGGRGAERGGAGRGDSECPLVPLLLLTRLVVVGYQFNGEPFVRLSLSAPSQTPVRYYYRQNNPTRLLPFSVLDCKTYVFITKSLRAGRI